MAEVSQWNRPNRDKGAAAKNSSYANRKGRPFARGLLAALVVVIGGVLAFYFICGRQGTADPTATRTTEKKRGKIAEATPAKVTNKVAQSSATNVAASKKEKPWPPPEAIKDERGIWRYPGGQRVFDPKDRERAVKSPTKSNIPKFKHPVEREIATLLTVEPGMMLFGTPKYSTFKKDFVESILDPIEITDEDSERDRMIKEEVIAAKKELAERVKAGEDVVQILKDTREELQRLAQYKRQIQSLINEQVRNAENSDADVEDVFTAANKMLENEGIAPMSSNHIMKRRQQILINEAQRQAREAAAQSAQ